MTYLVKIKHTAPNLIQYCLLLCLFILLSSAIAQNPYKANLSHYHTPQYNGDGKLVPWYTDESGPFHYIMNIQARWWLKAPDVNGWPVYLTASKLRINYEGYNSSTFKAF